MLALAYYIIGYWEREQAKQQAKQRKVHKKIEMKSSHNER